MILTFSMSAGRGMEAWLRSGIEKAAEVDIPIATAANARYFIASPLHNSMIQRELYATTTSRAIAASDREKCHWLAFAGRRSCGHFELQRSNPEAPTDAIEEQP
jgi:hypothetical protein